MHQGFIPLPEPLQCRCVSLINIGSMMRLYSIRLFVHVMDVHQRIIHNKLRVMDLQDLIRLCDAVSNHDQVNDSLKEDIAGLKSILALFIDVASIATRPCGMWNAVELEFDEDQLL